MDENNSLQLFEDRKIRTAWDEEQEEWYFSVCGCGGGPVGQRQSPDYLKKMRKRWTNSSQATWGQIVPR